MDVSLGAQDSFILKLNETLKRPRNLFQGIFMPVFGTIGQHPAHKCNAQMITALNSNNEYPDWRRLQGVA